MPRVFQTFKTKRNPETGKREPVLDRKGDPVPHERWRFQYVDHQGRRRTKTGCPTEAETLKLAMRVEAREYEIREGWRPAPRSFDAGMRRRFLEVAQEYLAWGKAQGGRGGRPWGKGHARMRQAHLAQWANRLGLTVLADVQGTLPRVEAVIRERLEAGKAPKTVANEIEALRALCEWCKQRGYLPNNPLDGLAPLDTTPKSQRRALTPDEIRRLLDIVPADRRLMYRVALATGLRKRELQHLTKAHLDPLRCGVHLDAAWTKSRKPGFSPLPRALFRALADSVADKPDTAPLVAVSTNAARRLKKDLKAAGIPKWTPEGKIDFHSLRVTAATLAIEAGANPKELQSLLRHATPDLSMNVYAQARRDGLANVAERIGKALMPRPDCVTGAQRQAAGAETLCPPTRYVKRSSGSNPALSARVTCRFGCRCD